MSSNWVCRSLYAGSGLYFMSETVLDVRWWHSFKDIRGISVVHVDLSPHAPREGAAVRLLDCREKDRWQRYAYSGPRRRFLLCRAALRAMLCEHLACDNGQLGFATTRYGKPVAQVNNMPALVSFNVSHSGRHGLIGISRAGRLGVDIEERDSERDLGFLIDSVLNEREKTELNSRRDLEKTYLFFKLWTLKEALLKAVGKGFHLDATGIAIPDSVLRGVRKSILQIPQSPGVSWHIEDLGNEDFAAAIAYEVVNSPVEKD